MLDIINLQNKFPKFIHAASDPVFTAQNLRDTLAQLTRDGYIVVIIDNKTGVYMKPANGEFGLGKCVLEAKAYGGLYACSSDDLLGGITHNTNTTQHINNYGPK
jgi:hypothetical protein